jgi:hypothetical protein
MIQGAVVVLNLGRAAATTAGPAMETIPATSRPAPLNHNHAFNQNEVDFAERVVSATQITKSTSRRPATRPTDGCAANQCSAEHTPTMIQIGRTKLTLWRGSS